MIIDQVIWIPMWSSLVVRRSTRVALHQVENLLLFFFVLFFLNLIIYGGRAIIEEDFSQLLNSDLVLFWEHPIISIFGFCRKGEWSRMERDFCFWSFRRSSGTVDQDTRQWWPFRWWFCWTGKVSNFYFFYCFVY